MDIGAFNLRKDWANSNILDINNKILNYNEQLEEIKYYLSTLGTQKQYYEDILKETFEEANK